MSASNTSDEEDEDMPQPVPQQHEQARDKQQLRRAKSTREKKRRQLKPAQIIDQDQNQNQDQNQDQVQDQDAPHTPGDPGVQASPIPAPAPTPASTPALASPDRLVAGQLPPFSTSSAGTVLQELLATLGHEFSTPLTVIEGYTDTLLAHQNQLTPAEHSEFLQMIQRAGRHLERITRRLLEIAQLEAGILQLDQRRVDIAALARDALARAEDRLPLRAAQRDRVTLALHCRDGHGNPTDDAPPVAGDSQRLRQLLEHLLDNAVAYSPTGGAIDVIIRPAPQALYAPNASPNTSPNASPNTSDPDAADRAQEPGRVRGKNATAAGNALGTPGMPQDPFVELCVCDNGIGIPEEQLERIFTPFYRVDTNLTRERYGLGLGLTWSKLVAELHRGRIWARSCPDGGSAVHVWLPRWLPPEEPRVT